MDSIADPVARPLSSAPAGIFTGQRISVRNNQTIDVIALVDGKGNFRVSSVDGSELYAGTYTINGSNLTIAALRYTPTPTPTPASTTADAAAATPAQTTTSINASGSFDTSSNLQLTYNAADGDFGRFQLVYQTKQYESRSNLSLLAGNWGELDAYGFPTIKISIDTGGNLSGKDNTTACTYGGTLGIIDIHYNLYKLSLTRQCGAVSADTSGFATLLKPAVGDQQLVFITASASEAMLLTLDPL